MPWVTVLSVTLSPTLTGAGFGRLGEAVHVAVGGGQGLFELFQFRPI
jgi:hypothetical protein